MSNLQGQYTSSNWNYQQQYGTSAGNAQGYGYQSSVNGVANSLDALSARIAALENQLYSKQDQNLPLMQHGGLWYSIEQLIRQKLDERLGFGLFMNNYKISNLGEPLAAQDAATKDYVDRTAAVLMDDIKKEMLGDGIDALRLRVRAFSLHDPDATSGGSAARQG